MAFSGLRLADLQKRLHFDHHLLSLDRFYLSGPSEAHVQCRPQRQPWCYQCSALPKLMWDTSSFPAFFLHRLLPLPGRRSSQPCMLVRMVLCLLSTVHSSWVTAAYWWKFKLSPLSPSVTERPFHGLHALLGWYRFYNLSPNPRILCGSHISVNK